ncbi:MAG: bifunctional riboflavin kinase/FAD synthetase [Eubacterium sp.]|nr:bifunctional riboflavin kinase/FAD synthetase [Eubacterium sp.]
MQTFGFDDNKKMNNTIVTIGKFDGIHKGHEKLLEILKQNANGRQKVVLTFEAAPSVFLKEEESKTIVTEQEKKLLLEELGVDVYIKMPLTKEFLAMSPEEFIEKVLKEKLGATTIVCGTDFHFGSKAAGDVKFLEEHQKQFEYSLIVVEKEQYNHRDISSSVIRELIARGEMLEVNRLLDHPYRIIGRVQEGKQLGRTIDIPTANLIPEKTKLLPPNGVYRTEVVVEGIRYHGISNVGVNPTVENGKQIKVETHIIDFKEYIYHEVVEVQFFGFIRPERKFENLEELQKQIQEDIKACQKLQK